MKKIKSRLKKVNWKLLKNIVYWLIVAVLAIIAGVTAVSALNIPGSIKLYTVQSGSMAPAIPAGSLVVSKPADDYRVGEVITFKAEKDKFVKNPKYTTTHRIHEIKETETEIEYVTKGDANDAPDSKPVAGDLVLGKTIFSIPLMGYPVSFAKTKEGLIVLIVIPATMIIYSEALNIKNEAKRLIQERKKRKLSAVEKAEVAVGKGVQKTEKGLKKFFKKFKFRSKNKK
jgi:signal peptidase